MFEFRKKHKVGQFDSVYRVAFGLCQRFAMRVFRLCRESNEIEVVFQFTDSTIWVTDLILIAEDNLENDEFVISWLVIVYDWNEPDLIFHCSSHRLSKMRRLSPGGIGGHSWKDILKMKTKMQ